MLRKFFSLYFWVTWVALVTASGLFLLESFRAVVSTADIVIIPKTETTVTAAGNAVALIRSESFFDRTVIDLEQPLSAAQWAQAIHVELQPNSSTLRLSVEQPSRTEASRLMTRVTQELGAVLSQWYVIPRDLDLRVIDGPRLTATISSWPFFIVTSISLGFSVTFGFFLFLALVDRGLRRRARSNQTANPTVFSPDTFRPSAAVPYWSEGYGTKDGTPAATPVPPFEVSGETVTAEPEELSPEIPTGGYTTLLENHYGPETVALESVFAEDERLEAEAPQARSVGARIVTGPAPDNLPIVEPLSPLEDANARLVAADINATARVQSAEAEAELVEAIVSQPEPLPAAIRTGEPTQEDYKRRLNELLSGKM